jgi:hypothetical protein
MRVYQYGLLPPRQGSDHARRQMWLAHVYRNDLIAIERGRRAAQRLLYSSAPNLAPLEEAADRAEQQLQTALRDLKACRAKTRKRDETQEHRDAVTHARVLKRDAVQAVREARRSEHGDAALQAERERINAMAHALHLNCRSYCGVYWGSYLLAEAAQDASIRDLPLYDGMAPNDPAFLRWDGNGRLGVQIQGGLAVEDVFGGVDTRIQIDPVDDRAWYSTSRSERRRRSRTILRVRVGSTGPGGRVAIWAEFPMIMHRPLPAKSRIKEVALHCRRRAGVEHWTVTFTVDDSATLRSKLCGTGAVAIDLGWRLLEDGSIRVGAWKAEDGESGEVVLDKRWLGGLRKCDELRSIRDKEFDAARAKLLAWMGSGLDVMQVPEWFVRDTMMLSQWRSQGRLARVAQYWRYHRFEGDAEGFDALEAWRYHDDHLWRWELNQRERSLLNRKERFRIFAAWLARRYSTLILEDFDLSQMARKAKPEKAEGEAQAPRTQRQMVAPSELRSVLCNAFSARGGRVIEVCSVDTTRVCHACGAVNHWDQAAYLRWACSACGAGWDQDDNASENILSLGFDEIRRLEQLPPKPPAEKQSGSRFMRAKAAKVKRLAEQAAGASAE